MKLIINIVLSAVAVIIGAYLIPGVKVDGFGYAIIVAIVISILNALVKPILVILTIPVTFFTLGLFLFVIDAIVILMAGNLISGFHVNGFWPALFFSIIIGIISWLLTDKRNN
jgi:putative membrane protein